MQLRKATRQQVKLKVALAGPSGSGKTMSALLMAYGMTGDWEKIAVIDTENRSSELYAHLGEYNVLSLEGDYSPDRYVKAIEVCEAEPSIEVIIIDSMTHEWDGKGGILEIKDRMTGNSFTNWSTLTPLHNKFIDKILNTNRHVIATMRTKTDYVLVEKNGKQVPEKVGMKAITREGVEYEFTLAFDLDIKNNAVASKDRTTLFMGQHGFVITAETGKMLKEWAESGVDVLSMALAEVAACKDVSCTAAVWNKYSQLKGVEDFKKAVAEKGSSLKEKAVTKTEVVSEGDSEETQPDAKQKVPANDPRFASDAQKNEIIRLLNNEVIPRQEKTKILLGVNRYDQSKAEEQIAKINQMIRERNAPEAESPEVAELRGKAEMNAALLNAQWLEEFAARLDLATAEELPELNDELNEELAKAEEVQP